MWPIWVVVNILDFMNLSNVTNIIEVPNCTRRKKICEMRKKMPVSTFSLDACDNPIFQIKRTDLS